MQVADTGSTDCQISVHFHGGYGNHWMSHQFSFLPTAREGNNFTGVCLSTEIPYRQRSPPGRDPCPDRDSPLDRAPTWQRPLFRQRFPSGQRPPSRQRLLSDRGPSRQRPIFSQRPPPDRNPFQIETPLWTEVSFWQRFPSEHLFSEIYIKMKNKLPRVGGSPSKKPMKTILSFWFCELEMSAHQSFNNEITFRF